MHLRSRRAHLSHLRYNIATDQRHRAPTTRRTEARIVALSVVMSVIFGPIGMAISGWSVLGGLTVSPVRFVVLTGWFALYGAAMGLAIAFGWRVECGIVGRRRRTRAQEDYWIGDWSTILDGHGGPPRTPGGAVEPSPLPRSGPAELS